MAFSFIQHTLSVQVGATSIYLTPELHCKLNQALCLAFAPSVPSESGFIRSRFFSV